MSFGKRLGHLSVMVVLLATALTGCNSDVASGPAPAQTKGHREDGGGKSALGEPNAEPKSATTPGSH